MPTWGRGGSAAGWARAAPFPPPSPHPRHLVQPHSPAPYTLRNSDSSSQTSAENCGITTHPGGAGLGGRCAGVCRKDAPHLGATGQLPPALLAWEPPGFRAGQDGDPEVQSLKYLGLCHTFRGSENCRGEEGAVGRKRWLDWTGRRRRQ